MNLPHAIIASAIDAVRVNRCWLQQHPRGQIWVKRRRAGMGWMIRAGNVFLRASASRIQMFPSVWRWIQWEMHSFALLNGDRYSCGQMNARTVWFEQIPGRNLREIFKTRIDLPAVRAAGRELARTHAIHSDFCSGPWSHGDPHLGNLIYDQATDRARIIDFETEHDRNLTPPQRHADDVLTFVLELAAKSLRLCDEPATVEPVIREFVDAYGCDALLACLDERLQMPRGLELILWQTRTDHASPARISAIIDMIRSVR